MELIRIIAVVNQLIILDLTAEMLNYGLVIISSGLHVLLTFFYEILHCICLLNVIDLTGLVNQLVELLLEGRIASLRQFLDLLQLEVHFGLLSIVFLDVARRHALRPVQTALSPHRD